MEELSNIMYIIKFSQDSDEYNIGLTGDIYKTLIQYKKAYKNYRLRSHKELYNNLIIVAIFPCSQDLYLLFKSEYEKYYISHNILPFGGNIYKIPFNEIDALLLIMEHENYKEYRNNLIKKVDLIYTEMSKNRFKILNKLVKNKKNSRHPDVYVLYDTEKNYYIDSGCWHLLELEDDDFKIIGIYDNSKRDFKFSFDRDDLNHIRIHEDICNKTGPCKSDKRVRCLLTPIYNSIYYIETRSKYVVKLESCQSLYMIIVGFYDEESNTIIKLTEKQEKELDKLKIAHINDF